MDVKVVDSCRGVRGGCRYRGRGGVHKVIHVYSDSRIVIHIEDYTGDQTGRDQTGRGDTREEREEGEEVAAMYVCIVVNMYSCCGA